MEYINFISMIIIYIGISIQLNKIEKKIDKRE